MPEEATSREAFSPDVSDISVDRKILQAVKSLHYGSVEITVHDSKVVQIERKERLRFDRH